MQTLLELFIFAVCMAYLPELYAFFVRLPRYLRGIFQADRDAQNYWQII